MKSVISWLSIQYLGIPYGGWILIIVLSVLEYFLGHCKDKRFRSVAGTLKTILGVIFTYGLSKVPGVGPIVLNVLRLLLIIPSDQTQTLSSNTEQHKSTKKPQ